MSQETGLQYLETILRYLYSATDSISVEKLIAIAQHTLAKPGGDMAMTIAEQLLTEGRKKGIDEGLEKGLEKGTIIGEILLAQRILKLTIFTQEELEQKRLDDLHEIFASLETKLLEYERHTES